MNEQSKTNIGTIRIIGWCSILLSMIVILSELVSLVFYDPMNQFDQLLRTFPQLKVGAITAYTYIFQYGRIMVNLYNHILHLCTCWSDPIFALA